MTHLFNDPTTFMEDALEGFLDANSGYAVIVGGGSGHYPAFCGVVGPGFADGAVVGHRLANTRSPAGLIPGS